MENYWNSPYVLLLFAWIFTQGFCENSPPIISFSERHWNILEDEPVRSRIAVPHVEDRDGDKLIFALEPRSFFTVLPAKPKPLPFRIDSNTGVVYLNETLMGRVGESIHMYVTVTDGHYPAKYEIWVSIINSSAPQGTSPMSGGQFFPKRPGMNLPPQLMNFPGFSQRPTPQDILHNPPPAIANNPPPLPGYTRFNPKYHLKANITGMHNKKEPSSTVLLPVSNKNKPEDVPIKTETSIAVSTMSTTMQAITDSTKKVPDIRENLILPIDRALKSVLGITTSLVPILSVLAVFLIVGAVGFICRQKIYLAEMKNPREEKSKETANGVVLQEDPARRTKNVFELVLN